MSAYSDKVIADGAVAYWRLNELSGTTAASLVGSFPGTISGGVTLNQPGALADGDLAMAFNGSDGKARVAAPTYAVPNTFTVEVWFKTTSNAQMGCWSNREGNPAGLYFGLGSGKAFTYHTSATPPQINGTRVVNNGSWHHYVLAHDGATARIYLDGVLDTSAAQTHPGGTGIISIGCDQPNSAFWNGSLDEVAVYPTALTAQQIADHVAAASLPAPGTAPYAPIVLSSAKPPHNGWTPITPSDIVDSPFSALWVGGAGTVAAVGLDGRVVTFTGIPAGTRLRISGRRVNDTATTATALLALGRT